MNLRKRISKEFCRLRKKARTIWIATRSTELHLSNINFRIQGITQGSILSLILKKMEAPKIRETVGFYMNLLESMPEMSGLNRLE